MVEKLCELPVPHIYEDASINMLIVQANEGDDASPCIVNRYDALIVTSSPDHARALARALMIAADACDRERGHR